MRRQQQTARRSVGFDYVPWQNHGGPSTWPLVVIADRGVTIVDASFPSPNDMSTANWVVIGGLSSRTTTDIAEDGSTGRHWLYTSVTNLVANKPVTFTIRVKPIDRSDMSFDITGGNFATFNLTGSGSVRTSSQCTASIAGPDGSGIYTATIVCTNPLSTTFILGACDSSGNTSYTGTNGLHALGFYGLTVTQRNVSAWSDVVTGNGRATIQGTALMQPTMGTLGSKPTTVFAGGQILYSSATWSALAQTTIYAVYRHTVANTARRIFSSLETGTHAQELAGFYSGQQYANSNGSLLYSTIGTDTNAHIAAVGFDGANSYLNINGTVTYGALNATTSTGIAIGGMLSPATNYLVGDVSAILVASRLHSISDNWRVMRWLSQWSGVAL